MEITRTIYKDICICIGMNTYKSYCSVICQIKRKITFDNTKAYQKLLLKRGTCISCCYSGFYANTLFDTYTSVVADPSLVIFTTVCCSVNEY